VPSLRLVPKAKWCVARDVAEVLIGGEHGQFMADAELREKSVDRRRLDTVPAARISQLGGSNMVVAGRTDEGERRESVEDEIAGLGAGEALKKLLKDQTRRDDGFLLLDGSGECPDFG
jgi:hypothetical protein